MSKSIIKLQTSLTSSDSNPEVMIYGKGRMGFWQGNNVEAYKLLGGPLKKGYFYARLRGSQWEIGERAPDQPW